MTGARVPGTSVTAVYRGADDCLELLAVGRGARPSAQLFCLTVDEGRALTRA